MGKVAMVEAGDREHPDEIQRDRNRHRDRAPSNPDDAEAHQVNDDVRDASEPIGLLRQVRRGSATGRRVEPSRDRNKKSSGITRRS